MSYLYLFNISELIISQETYVLKEKIVLFFCLLKNLFRRRE